jgi:hypothetical protein
MTAQLYGRYQHDGGGQANRREIDRPPGQLDETTGRLVLFSHRILMIHPHYDRSNDRPGDGHLGG